MPLAGIITFNGVGMDMSVHKTVRIAPERKHQFSSCRRPRARPLVRAYRCSDGRYIQFHVGVEKFARNFSIVIEEPELLDLVLCQESTGDDLAMVKTGRVRLRTFGSVCSSCRRTQRDPKSKGTCLSGATRTATTRSFSTKKLRYRPRTCSESRVRASV